MAAPPPPLSLSGAAAGASSTSGGGTSTPLAGGSPKTPSHYILASRSRLQDLQHHPGQASGFSSMRAGLEASFIACSAGPYLGRLHGPPSAPQQAWLSYSAVGARVRACAALLDALALGCGGACAPPGASRPFVAIGGPNSVEWVVADVACSGAFLPTVGMHPNWPPASVAAALDLTWAPIVALTSAALLPALAEVEAAGRPRPLQHIVLLDPSWAAGGGAASSGVAAAAAALAARGVRLWPPLPVAPSGGSAGSSSSSGQDPALATVSVRALHALALRALAGAPPSAAHQVRKWQELLEAAGEDGSGGTTADGASCLRLFVEPDAAWLRGAGEAEVARELAARATPLAGSADPLERPGPLYHPIAADADVDMARNALARSNQGGAGWVVAAESGDVEAAYDLACLWSVVFATGSSGRLKATPYTRAGWASAQGCNEQPSDKPEALGGEDGNKTVLSHCAMSHGLDRGFFWKALFRKGNVGMARDGSFEATREALMAFKPACFCTMPSFWERLYLETCEEVAGKLAAQAVVCGFSRDAAAALAAEQMRGLPSMLLEIMGAETPSGIPVSKHPRPLLPSRGDWREARTRPAGSLAHFMTSAVLALRDAIKRSPDARVLMLTGGAPPSWEAMAFFHWLVFNSDFKDAYAATEAAPIASGYGGALVVAVKDNVRLAPQPPAAGGAGEAGAGALAEWQAARALAIQWSSSREGQVYGRPCGELQVRGSSGAARRYFGAESCPSAAALSRAAFTQDGWWRSGDLVELFDEKGSEFTWLRVLGRKGDELELYIDGKSAYFGAAALTAVLAQCPAVHSRCQLALECKRDEDALVAVLVPADAWLEEWVREEGSVGAGSRAQPLRAAIAAACARDAALEGRLKAALVQALAATARSALLPPCWAPGGIVLELTPWSAQDGTGIVLVVSKPPSRVQVIKHYRRRIDDELTRVLGMKEGGLGRLAHAAADADAPAPAPAPASAPTLALDAWRSILARVRVAHPSTPHDSPLWGIVADLWGAWRGENAGWDAPQPSAPPLTPLRAAKCTWGDIDYTRYPAPTVLQLNLPLLTSALAALLPAPLCAGLSLRVVPVPIPSTVFMDRSRAASYVGDVLVACVLTEAEDRGAGEALLCTLRRAASALLLPRAAWPVHVVFSNEERNFEGGDMLVWRAAYSHQW